MHTFREHRAGGTHAGKECLSAKLSKFRYLDIGWRLTAFGIPLLRAQKVFAVIQDHILDARLKDDAAHWTLLPSAVPAPTSESICRHQQ